MTVPGSVFQCSLWTSPKRSRDTNTSMLWRSLSFQMLKVFPWGEEEFVKEYYSVLFLTSGSNNCTYLMG